jgi:hypothetical protein
MNKLRAPKFVPFTKYYYGDQIKVDVIRGGIMHGERMNKYKTLVENFEGKTTWEAHVEMEG